MTNKQFHKAQWRARNPEVNTKAEVGYHLMNRRVRWSEKTVTPDGVKVRRNIMGLTPDTPDEKVNELFIAYKERCYSLMAEKGKRQRDVRVQALAEIRAQYKQSN